MDCADNIYAEDNDNSLSSRSDDDDMMHLRGPYRFGKQSEFLSTANAITLRLWAGPHVLQKKLKKFATGDKSEAIKKRQRQKRVIEKIPLEIEEDDDMYTEYKRIKIKLHILNKWTTVKKQKLPENYQCDVKDFQNDYEDGKSKPIPFPVELDIDACPMVQNEQNQYSDDDNEGGEANLSELDDPEVVEVDQGINYAKKAKSIDMKQLKRCIYAILKDNLKLGNKTLQFNELCKALSKKLDPQQAEQLTMQIAMLALLFVVNEKNLELTQEDSKDFTIVMK